MTEARKSQHRPKSHRENTYRIAARTKPGAEAAGRTKYREEFERDYGPDLDEPLDSTETGHEF